MSTEREELLRVFLFHRKYATRLYAVEFSRKINLNSIQFLVFELLFDTEFDTYWSFDNEFTRGGLQFYVYPIKPRKKKQIFAGESRVADNVDAAQPEAQPDDLRLLYRILYGADTTLNWIGRKVQKFEAFDFGMHSPQFEVRLSQIENADLESVRRTCKLLEIPIEKKTLRQNNWQLRLCRKFST